MLSKKELLATPSYLLTKYQNEIYRQLVSYMDSNNLTQKEVAERLGVSGSYISQVLNGNFNFTLKKLIELGLMIGKVPYFEFVGIDEFWIKERDATIVSTTISVNVSLQVTTIPQESKKFTSVPKTLNVLTTELTNYDQMISSDKLICCSN
jgi:transcriptional regulator with XRE-family HTH domain